jgi:hypothetical protein
MLPPRSMEDGHVSVDLRSEFGMSETAEATPVKVLALRR